MPEEDLVVRIVREAILQLPHDYLHRVAGHLPIKGSAAD